MLHMELPIQGWLVRIVACVTRCAPAGSAPRATPRAGHPGICKFNVSNTSESTPLCFKEAEGCPKACLDLSRSTVLLFAQRMSSEIGAVLYKIYALL